MKNVNTENKYKVNLHLLELCNYSCGHCFAHFNNKKTLDILKWIKIIDNISESIPVYEFNLAGGEPLLYKDLNVLIKHLYDSNFKVSIITNGSLVSNNWIKENIKYIETIGFSIDSFLPKTLINMGRVTNKRKYLSEKRFVEICKLIKENNPNCKIKVNSVITSLNYEEDLVSRLYHLNIDRWKILKIKKFKNNFFDNSKLDITKEQFNIFVKNNNKINNIIIEESLINSYIMIDSNGFLVDNNSDNYSQVSNVLLEDFKVGFKKLDFDEELFLSRYK